MGLIDWNDGTTSTYGDGGGGGGDLFSVLGSVGQIGASYLQSREQSKTARAIADARIAAEQRMAQYAIDANARQSWRQDIGVITSAVNQPGNYRNLAIAGGLGLALIFLYKKV